MSNDDAPFKLVTPSLITDIISDFSNGGWKLNTQTSTTLVFSKTVRPKLAGIGVIMTIAVIVFFVFSPLYGLLLGGIAVILAVFNTTQAQEKVAVLTFQPDGLVRCSGNAFDQEGYADPDDIPVP